LLIESKQATSTIKQATQKETTVQIQGGIGVHVTNTINHHKKTINHHKKVVLLEARPALLIKITYQT